VESLVKTSHLLAPFPEAMIDTAFFDRFHAYIPGWEIPYLAENMNFPFQALRLRELHSGFEFSSIVASQAEF
jgi:Putative ATP-dependent Lon protease